MRTTAAGVLLGLGAAAVSLLLGWAGLLDVAELKLYDWRLRLNADPAAARSDIVLVEINDTSIRDYAAHVGRWPWPRVLQSNLIDFLARGRARVIAYDILLSEPSHGSFEFGGETWTAEESDTAMVDAVREAGRVILLSDAVNPGVTGSVPASSWKNEPYRLGPAVESRPIVLTPIPALAEAARGLGHNFLAFDPDGPVRRMAPFIRSGERYMPSLGVAAALAAGGYDPKEVTLEEDTLRIRDRRMPLVRVRVQDAPGSSTYHEQLTTLVNYRVPIQGDRGARPYKAYEARHLLHAEDQLLAGLKPDVDPLEFRDKIVFVGLTASGLIDVFPTPFGDRGQMPGIQLHAQMADNLLSNQFMRPAPGWSRILATLVLGLAAGIMSATLPFAAAVAGAVAAIGGWTWIAAAEMRAGLWLNVAAPVSAGAFALFAGTAYRYFVEDREKRQVKRLFGRYVSRDIFTELIAHPEQAELGGVRRDMTVLFSDIRGFTSITEKGDPEALVAQLNEYFTRMVEIVFRHRGTVDKFVGDMVMALFGAPLDDADHAEHAAAAAVDMVAALGELNRKWLAEGRAALDIGIGINSGDMIAGNIGSSSIMSYTVIGDNVNLGSRLESLNKDYQTRIIMSEATRARLTGPYDVRPLGEVVVKGKSRPVAIFELRVPPPIGREQTS